MRPHGNPEELERRRMRAISLLKEGYQPVEISRMVGVDRRSVRRWKSAYKRNGVAALKAKPSPGRPSKLTFRQKQQVERALLKGAKKAGFPTDLWTCPRVAEVISKTFGVEYHPAHVWKILRSLRWTCQKPERRARERNEEAITYWREHEWPRIKRGRSEIATR